MDKKTPASLGGSPQNKILAKIYIYIYVHGHHLYMLKMHFEQCNIVNWKKDENKTCIKKAPS